MGRGAAWKLVDGAVRQPLKRDAESGGDAGGLGEVSSSHCPRAANQFVSLAPALESSRGKRKKGKGNCTCPVSAPQRQSRRGNVTAAHGSSRRLAAP